MNRAFVAVLATLSLGACGGIPQRTTDKEDLERYLQYAGEPVSSSLIWVATTAGDRWGATASSSGPD